MAEDGCVAANGSAGKEGPGRAGADAGGGGARAGAEVGGAVERGRETAGNGGVTTRGGSGRFVGWGGSGLDTEDGMATG